MLCRKRAIYKLSESGCWKCMDDGFLHRFTIIFCSNVWFLTPCNIEPEKIDSTKQSKINLSRSYNFSFYSLTAAPVYSAVTHSSMRVRVPDSYTVSLLLSKVLFRNCICSTHKFTPWCRLHASGTIYFCVQSYLQDVSNDSAQEHVDDLRIYGIIQTKQKLLNGV